MYGEATKVAWKNGTLSEDAVSRVMLENSCASDNSEPWAWTKVVNCTKIREIKDQ